MPITYAVYDSRDRKCSRDMPTADDLREVRDRLEAEAAEEGSRLTYAIHARLPDGSVTFDCG